MSLLSRPFNFYTLTLSVGISRLSFPHLFGKITEEYGRYFFAHHCIEALFLQIDFIYEDCRIILCVHYIKDGGRDGQATKLKN